MLEAVAHQNTVNAVLLQTLRITFDALADMYEGRDGHWLDELRDAAAEKEFAISGGDTTYVAELFDDLRKTLSG